MNNAKVRGAKPQTVSPHITFDSLKTSRLLMSQGLWFLDPCRCQICGCSSPQTECIVSVHRRPPAPVDSPPQLETAQVFTENRPGVGGPCPSSPWRARRGRQPFAIPELDAAVPPVASPSSAHPGLTKRHHSLHAALKIFTHCGHFSVLINMEKQFCFFLPSFPFPPSILPFFGKSHSLFVWLQK